ncbi:hypothetical protein [Nonomuraea sediminis]|uniref:hypothetical protein n=1 Tax=Nonomuraea sediminis TaxID=2835864 RepID=UPI001BDBE4AC|nr:hypothetical protein [Nonomuraea sediminis]
MTELFKYNGFHGTIPFHWNTIHALACLRTVSLVEQNRAHKTPQRRTVLERSKIPPRFQLLRGATMKDFDPLTVPDDIASPMMKYVENQDLQRGDWQSPRAGEMPAPPWPDQDNPTLRFLLWKADQRVRNGMPPSQVMLDLAVHAWFEGGIEGYDRGQRDARKPRSVG